MPLGEFANKCLGVTSIATIAPEDAPSVFQFSPLPFDDVLKRLLCVRTDFHKYQRRPGLKLLHFSELLSAATQLADSNS
jgi:hypothetical protein